MVILELSRSECAALLSSTQLALIAMLVCS